MNQTALRAAPREHYIPVRSADLVELLIREPALTAIERENFQQLAGRIQDAIHRDFHPKLEQLKADYALFDPDADTREFLSIAPEESQKRLDRLFDTFVWLLERANFKRLTADDIRNSKQGSNWWGLNVDVDLGVFDRLEVFYRGFSSQTRHRRRFRRLYRKEEVQVPIYRRLALMLRLRAHDRLGKDIDTESVFIKSFKDIPTMDLEMLLPGIRIKMTLLDRGKIGLPMLMGLGLTGWKLAGGLLVLAAGLMANTIAMIGIAGGTIGYALRSFYGYVRTTQKYRLTVYENLYFQSLASNRASLFHLGDKAEEQECRESILAYYFLWRHPTDEGYTAEELDGKVEGFLHQLLGETPDFEIADALDKLRRLGLVKESANGRIRAVEISEALVAVV